LGFLSQALDKLMWNLNWAISCPTPHHTSGEEQKKATVILDSECAKIVDRFRWLLIVETGVPDTVPYALLSIIPG